MGYLRDHPQFHHVLLLEQGDMLWLAPSDGNRWTLPELETEEQHTAEVGLIARHMRERYGARVAILGTAEVQFDHAAKRVRQVYLAEALAEPIDVGRWWSRAALGFGEASLSESSVALVMRWVAKALRGGNAEWSEHGWLADALAWVATRAGAVSEAEQVRVSESSTVVRVVTGGRALYFKAVAASASREPLVTAALGRRTQHVPAVLAVDEARRFLLMDSFDGEPLSNHDVSLWAAAARALGELQRDCLDAVPELQALGCEVTAATTLVYPLASLLADAGALLVGEPAGLTEAEVASLRALAPGLAADARALDDGPIPLTVDHGDLWPSNVLVGSGGYAFVDWEDARIAHPFISLFQLLAGPHVDGRIVDEPMAYVTVREAYLAGWADWAPAPLLHRAFDAAHDIAAIAVAASYRRQPAAVIAIHPWMREMPAFCLRRVLTRRAWAESLG